MSPVRSLTLLLLLPALLHAEDFQGSTHTLPYDESVINYSGQQPEDAVARLQKSIEEGVISFRKSTDSKFGWLPSLLEAFGVFSSSRVLVFSKTSQQRAHISPVNPRAIYFNDEVYIGYIPGAPLIEIATVDPKLGAIFYTVDQDPDRTPRFTRQADCLGCHGAGRSLGVPGFILRSIGTDRRGELEPSSEVSPIDQTTPLADRWAGWFVTGLSGKQVHRGNLVGARDFERRETEPGFRGNLSDLGDLVDPEKYPASYGEKPGTPLRSDIVALMVLEHQSHMQNYLTRLNYEARLMLSRYGHVRYLKSQVNAFLRYLLFTEEAPLSEPISGDPEWARYFTASAPRDGHGRSLRDLDLQTRLFKYPCSYLIYSPAFDTLPAEMREVLLGRLYDILVGRDPDAQFASLKADGRRAVLEILRETKKGLPEYWKEERGGGCE